MTGENKNDVNNSNVPIKSHKTSFIVTGRLISANNPAVRQLIMHTVALSGLRLLLNQKPTPQEIPIST